MKTPQIPSCQTQAIPSTCSLPALSRCLSSVLLGLLLENRVSPVLLLLLLNSSIITIGPGEERDSNQSLKFYWAENSRLLHIHWAVSKKTLQYWHCWGVSIQLAKQQPWAPPPELRNYIRCGRCWTAVFLSLLDINAIFTLVHFRFNMLF